MGTLVIQLLQEVFVQSVVVMSLALLMEPAIKPLVSVTVIRVSQGEFVINVNLIV